MPRLNRVDPFGDLHAVSQRGMFTGNRGCLVDDRGRVVRHHRGRLWIVCLLAYRDWKSPLDQPRRWTPIFFLDDAVALAAGHRPCGLCRRVDYQSYRAAVMRGSGSDSGLGASDLNRMLAGERLERSRGLSRAGHRKLWTGDIATLPRGTVIVGTDGDPWLVDGDSLRRFGFEGWGQPTPRPANGRVDVLTPPTSVLALDNGFAPSLRPSVSR